MSIPTNPAEPAPRKIAMQVYGDHIALVDHWTGSHVARLPLERMAEAKAFVAALEGAQAKPAEAGWIHAAFASYWWAKKDYTADPRQIAETAFHAGAALVSPQPAEVPALTLTAKALLSALRGPHYQDVIGELMQDLEAALAPQLALKEGGEE